MAHDVFVSHSAKDKTVADALVAKLESEGIRCWVAPRDVVPGADWGESIINAIESSRIMILIFSANANNSPQIKREIERAIHRGVYTLPFRIEDIQPTKSLEYFISTAHWLDAFTLPLGQHLESLAKTIKAILASQQVLPVSGVVPAPPASIPSSTREAMVATEQTEMARVPPPPAAPENIPVPPPEAKPKEEAPAVSGIPSAPPPVSPLRQVDKETQISPGSPASGPSRRSAIVAAAITLAIVGVPLLLLLTKPHVVRETRQPPSGAIPEQVGHFKSESGARMPDRYIWAYPAWRASYYWRPEDYVGNTGHIIDVALRVTLYPSSAKAQQALDSFVKAQVAGKGKTTADGDGSTPTGKWVFLKNYLRYPKEPERTGIAAVWTDGSLMYIADSRDVTNPAQLKRVNELGGDGAVAAYAFMAELHRLRSAGTSPASNGTSQTPAAKPTQPATPSVTQSVTPPGTSSALMPTFEIPAAKPVISVTIPGSWRTEKTENSIDCESPDKRIVMRYEVKPAPDASNPGPRLALRLLQLSVEFLALQPKEPEMLAALKLVAGTVKQGETALARLVNDRKYEVGGFEWRALDLDPQSKAKFRLGLKFSDVGNGNVLVRHYWESRTADTLSEHDQEARAITLGIKKIDR